MFFLFVRAATSHNTHTHTDIGTELSNARAIFTTTTRGRDQLIVCGQPYIYEKNVLLAGGTEKKLWRCNQWWNKRCRARVFTIGDVVTPLNKYHTHVEIIKRKKRVAQVRRRNIAAAIERTIRSSHEADSESSADVVEVDDKRAVAALVSEFSDGGSQPAAGPPDVSKPRV